MPGRRRGQPQVGQLAGRVEQGDALPADLGGQAEELREGLGLALPGVPEPLALQRGQLGQQHHRCLGQPAPDGHRDVDDRQAAGPVPSEPGGLAVVDVPVAVRRRLAETPVVLLAELTALEREWLWDALQREAETFAEFLGLTAEVRREGIALLDPAGELTDLRLPSAAAPAHAALLLVEHLVEQLRPLPESKALPVETGAVTGVPIPEALIDGTLGDVADEYGAAAGWCRDHLADRAAFRREVLELLHRMRLIAPLEPAARLAGTQGPRGRTAGGWMLLAPAARYAAQAELRPAPGTGRHPAARASPPRTRWSVSARRRRPRWCRAAPFRRSRPPRGCRARRRRPRRHRPGSGGGAGAAGSAVSRRGLRARPEWERRGAGRAPAARRRVTVGRP